MAKDKIPTSRIARTAKVSSLAAGQAARHLGTRATNVTRSEEGRAAALEKLITWPSFIAAPFIVPSAVTICSAASRWRRSSASWAPSLERATFAARVPACRTACLAARLPIFAVRATREVGILSRAIARQILGASPRPARYPRSTFEPGTMSSEPSGQRTHAL